MRVDKILIEGLRCMAHVGVPDAERKRRQPIDIDLTLGVDLKPAGKIDQVDRTVDYAAAAASVKRLVEGGSFRLVERVAQEAAEHLLKNFQISDVCVKIRKFSVLGAKSVGVEITRGKSRTTRAKASA